MKSPATAGLFHLEPIRRIATRRSPSRFRFTIPYSTGHRPHELSRDVHGRRVVRSVAAQPNDTGREHAQPRRDVLAFIRAG
jgi:hypothetical protein